MRKVLRVGAIRDGRIVFDRLVELDEDVVLGREPGLECSPGEGPWTLLKPSGGQHALRIPDAMRGRIRRGEEVLELSSIKSDPFSTRSGQGWSFQLQGREQGRLVLGEHVLLFTYLEVGRAPVRPFRPKDFRPPILEDGDRTFVGFLGVTAALAASLVAWVATTQPVSEAQAPILPPAVQVMAFEMPELEPLEVEVQEVADAPPAEAIALAPTPQHPPEAAPPAGPPEEPRDTRAALMSESILIQRIFTAGEGTPMGGLFAEEDYGAEDLDALIRGPRKVASTSAAQLRRIRTGGDVDIDNLGEVGGTRVETGDMAHIELTLEVVSDVEGVDLEGVTQEDRVAEVVRSKAGSLRYCYELRLKEVPSLRGRIEVEWLIRSGRVVDVDLGADTSGDPELVECVLDAIHTWRFPPSVRGEVSWPFVFRPSS